MRWWLLIALNGGCAFISDKHAAWRADPDGDGVSWTEDCEEGNASATEASDWYLDADGDGYGDGQAAQTACTQPDGYVAVEGDCDDADALIFPDAAETCDGADNDCDGDVDEDLSYIDWYLDGDGDGYGDAADVVVSCAPQSGRVADATDCDDTDANTYPGADETCDEADNDCDGRVDENVQERPTWYEDLDGDGHGNPEVTQDGCDAPDGYVAAGDDCDDTDASLWLAGEEEIFYNGVDDNCDPSDVDGDQDSDGYWASDYVDRVTSEAGPMAIPEGYGGDCDDLDGAINPVALDMPYDGVDADCNGSNDFDYDADGYESADWGGDDCDDNQADINPGATEIWYDGVDQDCDGGSDDDADGDGHDAISAGGDDCDDTVASTYTGAVEVCNAVDDDCDGDADDGLTFFMMYEDGDGDGYGDSASETETCEEIDGWVYTGADCDDLNAEVHPGAVERCATDDDDDCSGDTNDEDAEGCVTLYADLDDDGYGDPDSSACICDPTASFAVEDGVDCDDGDPDAYPDADEVCGNLVDEDCDGEAQTCDAALAAVVVGEASDEAGTAVAALDDLLLVGAPGHNTRDGSEAGALYLLPHDERGWLHLEEVATRILGDSDSDRFGEQLLALPDPEGDHRVAVAAPTADTGGVVYVLSADSESGLVGDMASYTIYGDTSGGELGSSLSVGLGMTDSHPASLVIGNAASGSGVWLAPLDGEGVASASELGTYIYASGSGAEFGADVLAVDLNLDGLDDLLVGVPGYGMSTEEPNYGVIFFYSAPLSGARDALDYTNYTFGETREDRFGTSLANVGDVNGDGTVDLVVGAEKQGNTEAGDDPGAVYIVTEPVPFASSAYATLLGATAKDWTGADVSVGDWDGDGETDLVVGAHGSDVFLTDAGISYVVFGPFESGTHELSDMDYSILGTGAGGNLGYASAATVDQDGDGGDELLLGMPNTMSPTGEAGQVQLFLSSDLFSE